MAEDKYATPVLDEGAYTQSLTTPLKGRRDPILGGIRDTILEGVASAIDVGALPYAYGRDYGTMAGDKKFEVAGQLGQQTASVLKDAVRSGKTDYGIQEDQNGGENSTWLGRTLEAIPSSAPQLVIAGFASAVGTPLAGAATYGAMADASQSQQFEEMLYNMPRDQLEKLPGYEKYRSQGMDHDDALRAMHTEMRTDPYARIPNAVMNTATGGIYGRVIGKVGSRTVAETMRKRIMEGIKHELPEASIGGALTGAAQSYGRQVGQMDIGMRDRYDIGEMADEAWKMGSTLTGISAGGIGVRSLRGPAKPRTGGTTGDLIDDANKRPVAPEIDTEQRVVATENLKDNPIGTKDTAPAPKPGEETVAPKPGEAAPVPPEAVVPKPGEAAPVPPEAVVTPAGKPAEAAVKPGEVAPEPVVGPEAPVKFRDIAAVEEDIRDLDHKSKSLEAASAEQKATPEWHQAMDEVTKSLTSALDEHDRIKEATAPPPVPPEAVAAHVDITAPPEAKAAEAPAPAAARTAETPEQFKARVMDLAQVPDHPALMAALKEFKEVTGKAFPESGKLMGAHAAAVKAARVEAYEGRVAEQRAARETKQAEEKVAKTQAREAKEVERKEKAQLKAEEAAAKKAAREEKAKAKTQAALDRVATREAEKKAKLDKDLADAAERKRLKTEADAAAAKVKAERKTADDAAAADAAKKADEAAKVRADEAARETAAEDANLAALKAEKPPEPKAAPAPEPVAAAKPAPEGKKPRPKSLAARIEAYILANPSTRYAAEQIPGTEGQRFGMKAVLVDVDTGKELRKYPSLEAAEKEAVIKNAEHSAVLGRRAIDEEDRVARTQKGAAKPVVTPEGKPAEKRAVVQPSEKATLVRQTDIKAKEEAAAKVKETQAEEAKAKAAREADAERKNIKRKNDQRMRDHAAQSVAETSKAKGHNMKGHLDATEETVRNSSPAEATAGMRQLIERGKDMAAAYVAKIMQLAKHKEGHETFTFSKTKDAEGKEVVRLGRADESRAGKGDWHSFLSDVNNLVREIERALDRGKDLHAKDLTYKYLDIMRAVDEGRLDDVTRLRQEFNDAVGTEKRTMKGGEAQVGAVSVETAKQKSADVMDEVNKGLDARVMLVDEKGKPILKDGRVQFVGSDETMDAGGWHADTPPHGQRGIPGQPHSEYVDGIRYVEDDYRVGLFKKALGDFVKNHGRQPTMKEILQMGRDQGHKVRESTFGELMAPHRPSNPIMGAVFDAVHSMVKDMPAHVVTIDMLHALAPNARAAYNPHLGAGVFRSDTLVERTVFHEALHAATARALYGSERLQHLVSRLQTMISDYYAIDLKTQGSEAYRKAIHNGKEQISTHEFLSELYTRPEVRDIVEGVRLRPSDVAALRSEGYAVDKGKTLLGTLWENFLSAIGYKPKNPNAMKVAVDMLQDVFDREHEFRARDVALNRVGTGKIFSNAEIFNLSKQDPIHGTAAAKAMQAGNHAEAASALMQMNERGTLTGETADKAITYLHDANRGFWGMDALPERVTPVPTREAIQSDVVNWVEKRFGKGMADKAWQVERSLAEKRWPTSIRDVMRGLQYTNDIGNTLEKAFQNVLQPIKTAWSRRENFATKYMDTSGANKLIDDIASIKHAIKDKKLIEKWENLLVRESYARTRADEELGVGANTHINTGDLRDRQSVQDHIRNRAILEEIKAADPSGRLLDLRNRIFDFTKRELDVRNQASVRDQLLQHKVVKHGDDVALSALTKDIRRENKKMTADEQRAMERVVGAKDSPTFKAYEKARSDIRAIMEEQYHQGPHVPFSRYGKHAVYAEYDVRPDAGVKYREVNPGADVHKMYDFADRGDAEHFIDNTLSHPDININLRNAQEVVFDKNTGEQAAHWTITKPDGTAKTYTAREEANAAMEKGDSIKKTDTKPDDIQSMKDAGQDVSHLEVNYRLTFNPREFVRFESEREAHAYREHLNGMFDTGHTMGEGPAMRTTPPNIRLLVSNVETPHETIGRANVAYTSAEMRQWINRQEASPEYQRMDPDEKEAWARKLRDEAARVTATAGRRSMNMPREYTKGASTDILKGMIGHATSNARAIADLTYRADIEKGLVDAEAYVNKYRNQSGFNARRLEGETEEAYRARRDTGNLPKGHRAREDALREIKTRLFAPPQVNGTIAQGIKRALQVSMISHLADTAYLVINAIEPWVFGAAISSSRHGWANTYKEMGEATRLIDPFMMAKAAFKEGWGAGKKTLGLRDALPEATNYEEMLLKNVTGERNTRGDGLGVGKMMNHMFDRGLAARDVGMEVERMHDPSSIWAFRKLDDLDSTFRAGNSGIETGNRALMAIANYRMEYDRALKEMGLPPNTMKAVTAKDGSTHITGEYRFNQKAHDQAVKYAEDMIFKAAGDYGTWNSPRYFNNPLLRMATQFRKYPLRIASVYAEAMANSIKKGPEGDQARKQLAYMLLAQGFAAGGLGTPLMSPVAGFQNALYMLGLSDDNIEDVEFEMRQALAKRIGATGTDALLRGVLSFSGADFSQKLAQDSFIFHGSPTSRKANDHILALAKMGLGASSNVLKNYETGVQKIADGTGQMRAGDSTRGMMTGMDGVTDMMQIKFLSDLMKAGNMAFNGPKYLPKDTGVGVTDVVATGLGFTPTHVARKTEAKFVVEREKRKDSEYRRKWVDRWLEADDRNKPSVWATIQRNNKGVEDPRLHITFDELWKAKQRKANEVRRDDTKLGVKLSGRQKAFADIGQYYDID